MHASAKNWPHGLVMTKCSMLWKYTLDPWRCCGENLGRTWPFSHTKTAPWQNTAVITIIADFEKSCKNCTEMSSAQISKRDTYLICTVVQVAQDYYNVQTYFYTEYADGIHYRQSYDMSNKSWYTCYLKADPTLRQVYPIFASHQ